MRRALAPLTLAAGLAAGFVIAASAGCGPSAARGPAPHSAVDAPAPAGPKIDSEEEYAAARAEYEALALEAPERAGQRARLASFLLAQERREVDGGHLDEALASFKQAATLWDASELSRHLDDAPLRDAAERLDRASRRRGAHREVVIALAVQISLAADAAPLRARYQTLAEWLRQGGADPTADGGAANIDGRERLIEDLEQAAEVWPSPFVVSELTTLYLDRQKADGQINLFSRRLRRGADLQELLARSQRTGVAYETARLYLRVSRLEEAAARVKKLEGQPGDDAQVRALVERLASKEAQPKDAVAVAQLLTAQGRDDVDVALRVCRDAAARFPQAPEPRMCAGVLALRLDQLVVALKNFEDAVRLDPDRLESWESLAHVYQARLAQVVSDENLNVAELDKQLARVERFYADAQKRFPGKPLRPSMADALFEVGRGYYNAGRLTDATRYLERTIELAATPQSLDLLAQIRLKKGDGREAAKLIERATNLPKAEQAEQLWWKAKLDRELGDALELAADAAGALTARRAALAGWEKLSGYGLKPEAQAEAALERAKLYYQLGERDAAIDQIHKAIDAAPDRGATYADAIAWLVQRGELEEALDAYHRALGRNEVTDYLKVYCSLWIVDLCRRAGQPEDPLATAYLRSTDGGKWYDDLARWATGRQPEATLLARADTPARKAEAAFYRAMRALAEGRDGDARLLWKQVLDTDMLAFFEYDMAAFYLKLGTAPSKPLLKVKAPTPRVPRQTRPPDGSI